MTTVHRSDSTVAIIASNMRYGKFCQIQIGDMPIQSEAVDAEDSSASSDSISLLGSLMSNGRLLLQSIAVLLQLRMRRLPQVRMSP